MKKIFSLGLMLAALALTCCSKDAVEEQMNPAGAGAFELVADLDGGRTVADGIQTAWAAADAINVWTNVSGEKTYTSHGSFAITLTGTAGVSAQANDSQNISPGSMPETIVRLP